jgi:hypothetical protein
MTYGWAIVILLLVLGVLFYFGIINPDMFIPEECTIPSSIYCEDYKLNSTDATFRLANSNSWDVTILKVKVIGQPLSSTVAPTYGNCTKSFTVGERKSITRGGLETIGPIQCSVPFNVFEKKMKADIELTYYFTKSDPSINHTVRGEMIVLMKPD